MAAGWTGVRPERIPMVPERLTVEAFGSRVFEGVSHGTLFLGMNKSTAEPESFELFRGKSLAVFPGTAKQAALTYPFVIDSLVDAVASEDLVVIDPHDALKPLLDATKCLYVGKAELRVHADAVKRAITDLVESGTQTRRCIVISGAIDVFDRLTFTPDQVVDLLGAGSDNAQVILLDHMSKVNGNFTLTAPLKENVDRILFGGDMTTQRFVDNLPLAVRRQATGKNVLHSLEDDELSAVVIPTAQQSEG
jgi:S-DNA-T family DNA segregation ATPase FtsK/SpoIIIE